MGMTVELILLVVTAVVTGVLGAFLKDKVVPAKYIPIQNLVIGILSALVAVYFKLFPDIPVAIFVCVATSMGVGGTYDLSKINK